MSKAKEDYYYRFDEWEKDDGDSPVKGDSAVVCGHVYIKELEQQNKQLLEMINDIPCSCSEMFKKRNLADPDCPRCNWIDEEGLSDE